MAMPVCLYISRGAKFYAIVLLTSLAFTLSSCQTTNNKTVETKTQEVLNSQKAIIHNALDSGDTRTAHQTLRQLLLKFPDDASLHSLMGLTQLSMKNGARAVRHFQTAYNLDKSLANALNLSSGHIDVGDYTKAINLINNAMKDQRIKEYPYKERFYHNLGYATLKLNKSAKAEEYLKLALEENPSFYPSHLELARLQKSLGRAALAISSYRNAIDYCHVCLDPVSELTTLYVKGGRLRDARDVLIRYNKIQGVSEQDRKKAASLLHIVTASDLQKTTQGKM